MTEFLRIWAKATLVIVTGLAVGFPVGVAIWWLSKALAAAPFWVWGIVFIPIFGFIAAVIIWDSRHG